MLSLTFATIFNSTTFSSSRRRLRRAKPSGPGEQVRAISFASAAPSKIRGRAEFGLYLRFSVASNHSSTSCFRVRLLMLVSSVDGMFGLVVAPNGNRFCFRAGLGPAGFVGSKLPYGEAADDRPGIHWIKDIGLDRSAVMRLCLSR